MWGGHACHKDTASMTKHCNLTAMIILFQDNLMQGQVSAEQAQTVCQGNTVLQLCQAVKGVM